MSGMLSVGLFGIQPAMAELAISRPGWGGENLAKVALKGACLLYTSPSPRD